MASAWSKDLKITATINKALVAQCIAAETPVGDHSHDDREVDYKQKSRAGTMMRRKNKSGEYSGGWPRQSGRLKHALGHVPNWHMTERGQACYNNVMLPYARIINFGGSVFPAYYNQREWRMHWSDGSPVFSTSRKGFTLPARNFIERGVQVFANHGGNAIKVEWAKGTDTA